jgi:hypothetical protein
MRAKDSVKLSQVNDEGSVADQVEGDFWSVATVLAVGRTRVFLVPFGVVLSALRAGWF